MRNLYGGDRRAIGLPVTCAGGENDITTVAEVYLRFGATEPTLTLRRRVQRMRCTGSPRGLPRLDFEQVTPAQKEIL
jgi:hypothetical protein